MSPRIDVSAAARVLRSRLRSEPRVCVVLGSGLGALVERLEEPVSVPFEDVPDFPPSGVAGHEGRFVGGRLGSTDVLFQCGRYHFYEGHPGEVVAAPVRTAVALGVGVIVLTNAAGAIREDLGPGDLVMLEDHINAMARSPLAGPAREAEARFPDMSAPYDAELRAMARDAARAHGVTLAQGVYAAVLGPAYETAAEVRMLGRWGADVVGMSTVPEVLVARANGVRCLAFSVVTNRATGLGAVPLSHDEVIEVGRRTGERLGELLVHLVPALEAAAQPGSTK